MAVADEAESIPSAPCTSACARVTCALRRSDVIQHASNSENKSGRIRVESRIEFKIQPGAGETQSAALEVVVGETILAHIAGAPLGRLCAELAAWADTASDAVPKAFIFSGGGNPSLLGSFRIEPRPVGWQFTSTVERGRHDPLPLAAFVAASAALCGVVDAS